MKLLRYQRYIICVISIIFNKFEPCIEMFKLKIQTPLINTTFSKRYSQKKIQKKNHNVYHIKNYTIFYKKKTSNKNFVIRNLSVFEY